MENNFENHILEWKEMNMKGRFVEARQFYFEKLFPEVIDNFVDKTIWPLEKVDVLFSVLGYTPEPIILAHKALNPRRHIIFHDKSVTHNEDNVRYLPQFLDDGFLKIEFADNKVIQYNFKLASIGHAKQLFELTDLLKEKVTIKNDWRINYNA